MRHELLLAGLTLFAVVSCVPSATVRPTVPAEPVGVVNDNILAYQGSAATGLETSREQSILPHSCLVLDPPSGPGELRIRVIDPEQQLVLDLHGEALRQAWSPCDCGGRHMPHCVHLPPPPPPHP